MTKRIKKRRFWTLLLALPLLLLGAGMAFGQTPPAGSQSMTTPGQPAAAETPQSYTGTDTCLHCHNDSGKSVERTMHWGTFDKGSELEKTDVSSCEGCHGSGKAHAEAELDAERNDTKNPEAKKLIFDFTAKGTTPADINKRCLACHANSPTHLNSSNSFHKQNEVSCINCHSPHHAQTSEKLLVKAQPDLCYSCHLQQKSQFNMPFRHRVNEGLIKCTDCHDQHGSAGVWESSNGLTRQLRTSDSGETVCFKCHKDKQGPFVFEHASVRIEGCAACHIPHGGANIHMLKYSNMDLQCLQCHTAASFGHTKTTGFPVMTAQNSTQQQACVLCHVQIHGSNFNAYFFR